MDVNYSLATLNACLNGLAALLLFAGWRSIKAGKESWHKILMGTAFVVSIIFLGTYLTRIIWMGTHRYPGVGFWKDLYLVVLFSHIVLAAAVPVLAIRTIYLALKRRFTSHKKIARWTLPIWMYVSVTGVLIYLMLYHWA